MNYQTFTRRLSILENRIPLVIEQNTHYISSFNIADNKLHRPILCSPPLC